jgi:hypothetical protein
MDRSSRHDPLARRDPRARVAETQFARDTKDDDEVERALSSLEKESLRVLSYCRKNP